MKLFRVIALLGAAISLGACTTTGNTSNSGNQPAPLATTVAYQAPNVIQNAKSCTAATGILSGKKYLVGDNKDDTAKGNDVGNGQIGAIVSQGSAAFIVRGTLKDMGATITKSGKAKGISYVLNTAHIALDIEQKAEGSLSVSGAGLHAQHGVADTLSGAEIYHATSGDLLASNAVLSTGDYTAVGGQIGRLISKEVVTGSVTVYSSTHLQRSGVESVTLAAILAVFDQFPALHQRCGETLKGLKGKQLATTQVASL